MTEERARSNATAPRVSLDAFVVAAKDVLCRNLDGEAVVVDLASGACFELDAIGTRIWEHIAAGATVAQILDALLPEYAVERSLAEQELLAFVNELVSRGLAQAASEEC